MLSFRQKILLVYVIIGVTLIGFLLFFSGQTVKNIAVQSMQARAYDFIDYVDDAKDEEGLFQRLREKQHLFFFRVGMVNDKGELIYDSHILENPPTPDKPIIAPLSEEVEDAFNTGMGYTDAYSQLLEDRFLYMGTAFDFNGKTYVMRTAFPFRYTQELIDDYERGFLSSSIVVLLLFSIMTWFVIHHLTRPIQEIIDTIRPYQEGKTTVIPEISRSIEKHSSEFGRLAQTLNSLSTKIKKQIETLTEERNQKVTLLESLVEGVIAVDDKLNITYLNNKAQSFLEMEPNVLGKPLIETGQKRPYRLLQSAVKKKNIVHDELILKKKGGRIYLDLVAAPIQGDAGAVLVLQDKSAQVSMLEMRKDFVANASHELKTPITIIRGFAETLQENPEIDPTVAQEITGKIVRNCERMGTLVHDLLTLSDIEHIPRSKLTETNLQDVIDHCLSRIHTLYPSAVIEIIKTESEEYLVLADQNLAEIAVGNLINNAAKYSPEPPQITIELSQDKKWTQVQVTDKGPGIPEKDLPHIFERFYTVNKAHSRKLGGSGLGLAIVQSIMEKHGGVAEVQSTLEVGTTFTLRFPVYK